MEDGEQILKVLALQLHNQQETAKTLGLLGELVKQQAAQIRAMAEEITRLTKLVDGIAKEQAEKPATDSGTIRH